MVDVKKLKEWLEIDGNTKAILAVRMGYKTTATIDNWITRKKIPRRELTRLETAMRSRDVTFK